MKLVRTMADDVLRAGNIPIFGAPPRYTRSTDLDDRVYKNLWGNFSEFENTSPDRNSKLVNVRFTIGMPHRTLKEDIAKARNILSGEFEEAGEKDSRLLNSFIFSEPVEDGENTYIKILNNLLEYMALGVDTMIPGNAGSPLQGTMNPYLDPSLRSFSPGGIPDTFPQFIVVASEETSVSESISNEVGDSFLANMLNFASNTVRDINFMTGGNIMTDSLNQAEASIREGENDGNPNLIADAIQSTNEWLSKSKDFASKFVGEDVVTVIAEGSQLILPKVWKGSSFTKRYNITIRLNSAFGDVYSIAKNIGIPFAHIVAAATPIQTARNSVNFPFLVQIDSPGMMNVRMGIITNITVTKGGKDGVWSNQQGIARSIDVNLEIADLYEVLPGVKDLEHHLDFHNTTRDFLSNLSGGVGIVDDETVAARMKSIHERSGAVSGNVDNAPTIGNSVAKAAGLQDGHPVARQIDTAASAANNYIETEVQRIYSHLHGDYIYAPI